MNVMIDLETLGTRPGSAIVQLAAVAFDAEGRHCDYEVGIDLASCLAAGLKIDAATMNWWLDPKRAEAAREVFNGAFHQTLRSALESFAEWLHEITPAPDVWGNGASFDLALLAEAFLAVDLPVPWKYSAERCYRTLAALRPDIEKPKPTLAHTALADARAQAEHAVRILREIRGNYADLLAQTVESQKVELNTRWNEIRRAHEALDSAGHPTLRGGSEEIGDGICKLAGERDQLKAQLDTIARAMGADPTRPEGHHIAVQRALHLAAKDKAKTSSLAT